MEELSVEIMAEDGNCQIFNNPFVWVSDSDSFMLANVEQQMM
jgi:hypothetical protein